MAIKKYGVMKGGIISLWRVLRCNPFSRGGVNYPEEDMEKLERIKYFFKEKENE
jgi:putative component of membrane protein insertase Oxa1/YidC/SpoIIIJ protein YidD